MSHYFFSQKNKILQKSESETRKLIYLQATYLQECGFILIFKEVVYNSDGEPKGNCDADLVLQVAKDTYENKFNKAIIVSSDGDYACLIE